MLDVLSEIYRQRGQAAPDRRGADRSVHTVGYLIEAPDPVTYLCTVSVFDSEPIAGVPATSMDYTDITAVHVLLDPFTGRPVHVLGPAGELPFGEVPFARDTRHVVTGHIIPPTSTGTYREDEAAWDRYSTMTFGGVTDVWQQGAGGVGNLIPNPDPQPTGAYDFGVADAAGSGWSSSASWYGIVNYCGPDVERTEAVTTSLASEEALASHTVWPVPTGTGGVAVTAASSYTLACHVYAYDGPSAAPTISVGMEWFDAAGDAISAADSTGITPSSTTSDLWLNVDGPFYYTGFFANPSETFTAPAGAAFARPRAIVVAGDASINEVYVAAFSMVAA